MSFMSFIFPKTLVHRGLELLGARVISLVNTGPPESTISSTPTPTRTTPTFLPPTRCTPSPSSEPTSFPFVAALGYAAIVVTVTLFCICRPTGRGSATPTRASIPKSVRRMHKGCYNFTYPPLAAAAALGHTVIVVIIKLLSILGPQRRPPRPSTLSTARNPWTSVFRITALLFPVLLVLANTNVNIRPSLAPILATIDRVLIIGWSHFASVQAYITIHGLRYLNIVLHGLVSHISAILIMTSLRRLWSHLLTWDPVLRYCLGVHILCVPAVASVSWLEWIVGFDYYFLHDPIVDGMNQLVLRITTCLENWTTFHLAQVSIALSIGALHAFVAGLYIFFYSLRTIAKRFRRAISTIEELEIFLSDVLVSFSACVAVVIFQGIRAMISIPICWYITLPPGLQQILRDSISSKQSRIHAWQILLASLRYYQDWKANQIGVLNAVILSLRAPWRLCFETWNSVSIPQKFLIVAPAIILYGYVYIIPIFRKLALRVRYWHRQRRWYGSPLHQVTLTTHESADFLNPGQVSFTTR